MAARTSNALEPRKNGFASGKVSSSPMPSGEPRTNRSGALTPIRTIAQRHQPSRVVSRHRCHIVLRYAHRRLLGFRGHREHVGCTFPAKRAFRSIERGNSWEGLIALKRSACALTPKTRTTKFGISDEPLDRRRRFSVTRNIKGDRERFSATAFRAVWMCQALEKTNNSANARSSRFHSSKGREGRSG